MDEFFEEKTLDELHSELILELERLSGSTPADLTFSDASTILYVIELYFEAIERRFSYLKETPHQQILIRLKRNLDDQLKLMENHQDPDENLWFASINLAKKYLTSQNSHTFA